MKKTFINKTVAFASSALLLSLFASCSPEVEDTTANYAEKEREVTTAISKDSHTAKGADSSDVSVSRTSITTASKDTQIEVRISSYAKIDVSSVIDAINFYTLSDNSENKYYYSVRGSALGKDLLHTTEPRSYTDRRGDPQNTTFLFNVDTSSVTTNKIALVIDATKLKDKSGNAVLNLDKDDVAGEETDSYIKYITVSYKSDGETRTTALNSKFDDDEEFYEKFNNAYLSDGISESDLLDADGNLTGKIRFTVSAPKKSVTFSDTGSPTWAYDDSVASSLASIYKLQTKAPDATSWSDVALSFTYHSDSDSTGDNPVYAYTYTADTSALSYGTQWRLVRTNITSGSAPSDYAKYYGHAGYFFYCGSKEYTEVVGFSDSGYSGGSNEIFTSTVYTTSPLNIYAFGTTEAATTDFDARADYTDNVARRTQKALLSVKYPEVAPAKWYVTPNGCELDSSTDTGFIVTNENNEKVESSVNVITGGDSDNRIITVEVALKNTEVGGTFKLWVGNGTTLKSNPSYPTQKKFGVPADSSKGDVSGYVCLWEGGVAGIKNYEFVTATSPSSDITAFVLTHVEGTDYTDYYYKLSANSVYTIQIANGYYYFRDGYYYSNSYARLLENAGKTGCYYGAVSITYFDGTSFVGEDYTSDTRTFCPTESGVYKVRVRSSDSDYSGYVGFHIYKYRENVSSVNDTDRSPDIRDYTLAQIDSSNPSEEYYYYLEDGYYGIQLTNGYTLVNGDTLLSDSGKVPACYCGQVEVYEIDSDGDFEFVTTVSYSSTGSFRFYDSGVYCIRITKPDNDDGHVYEDEDGTNENVHLYDGYVGFHIYKD